MSCFFLAGSLLVSLFQWEILLYTNADALALGIDAVWTKSYLHISELFLLMFFIFSLFAGEDRSNNTISTYVFWSILGLSVSIFLSYFSALDPWLHILKSRHILEGIMLFYFLSQKTLFERVALYTFVAGSLGESVLMTGQFLMNQSIGLTLLKEPILSSVDLTTAKFHFLGEPHIRAYGTFLHPNIAAGYLLLTFFLILWKKHYFGFLKNWQYCLLLFLIGAGIFTSFSKTAFFVLFTIGILWMTLSSTYFTNVFHTIEKKTGFLQHIKIDFFRIAAALAMILLLFVLLLGSIGVFFDSSTLTDRLVLIRASILTFFTHPFGAGLGSFILTLTSPALPLFLPWEYQPVHSVFLLSLKELGILGGISYTVFFLSQFFTRIKTWYFTHTLSCSGLGIVLTYFCFAAVDHFWLTSYTAGLILMCVAASIFHNSET